MTNCDAGEPIGYFETTEGPEEPLPGPIMQFDRIDVSNTSDEKWLGIDKCLSLSNQYLNPENPKATLITFFMQAIRDMEHPLQTAESQALMLRPELHQILLPKWINKSCKGQFMSTMASKVFRDLDSLFAHYQNTHLFFSKAIDHSMVEKDEHTIIEKHPYAIKITDSKEEIDYKRFQETNWGSERYMEWRRATNSEGKRKA